MICKMPMSAFAMKLSVLASSAALLYGCSSMTPEQRHNVEITQRAAREQYEAAIPRCSSDKECQAKWAAARRWVLDHCGFKLEHVTDDFMETFNSGNAAATQMWCRVTKSPINETAYKIELENGANNWFGNGDMPAIRAEFNAYVSAAWQSPAPGSSTP